MSLVCPNGHQSEAVDFCDTCGAKIDATAPSAPPASPASPASSAAASGASGASAASGAAASPATPGGGAPAELPCPNCQVENLPGSLFCEACGYDFTTGAMPRAEPDPAGSSLDLFGETPAAPTAPDPVAAPDPEPGPTPDPEPVATPDPDPSPTPDPVPAPDPTPTADPVPAKAEGGSGIPPAIPMEWVAEVWIDPDWYAGQEAEDPMPSPGLPVVVPLAVRSALIGRVSASKSIHPDIDCTSDTGVSRRHAQLTTDGTRWFIEDLGSSNGTFVGGAAQALPEDPIPVGPKRELEDDERIYVGAWTRIVVRRATDEEKAAAAGSPS